MNAQQLGNSGRQRGIATVEFAIFTPVLLFLILAIAEIGRAVTQYATLANAVRNSVRYVAGEAYPNSSGVMSVNNNTTLINAAKNLVAYGKIVSGGSPLLPGLSPTQVDVSEAGGVDVTVTATYPYSPIVGATLPTFGFGSPIPLTFNMKATSRMRALP